MRYITGYSTLLIVLLIVVLTGNSGFLMKNSELRDFKIEIERTKNGVKLKGLEGTAFKELSFPLRDNEKQGVNEFGMVVQKPTKNSSDEDLAHFEFIIERINNKYTLVGKTGTAWTKVSFTFSKSKKVIIDQDGVTTE